MLNNSRHSFEIGMKNPENLSAIFIDYFKLRLDQVSDFPAQHCFINFILKEHGMSITGRTVKPSPGYDKGYKIAALNNDCEVCGAIEFSEKRQRIILALSGTGCSFVAYNDPHYAILSSLAGQPNARLSRLDLAHNDYAGKASIQKVDRDYNRGLFDPITGKRPLKLNVGDKSKGRTRYIGGKSAYKKVVVYEKAKQLGISSPGLSNWIRTEVRFTANSRDNIPVEAIAEREAYFFSACPKAMRKLIGQQAYVSVAIRCAIEYQAQLGRTLKHARYQYGPAINAAKAQFTSDELISLLSREPKCDRHLSLAFVSRDDLVATRQIVASSIGELA